MKFKWIPPRRSVVSSQCKDDPGVLKFGPYKGSHISTVPTSYLERIYCKDWLEKSHPALFEEVEDLLKQKGRI